MYERICGVSAPPIKRRSSPFKKLSPNFNNPKYRFFNLFPDTGREESFVPGRTINRIDFSLHRCTVSFQFIKTGKSKGTGTPPRSHQVSVTESNIYVLSYSVPTLLLFQHTLSSTTAHVFTRKRFCVCPD